MDEIQFYIYKVLVLIFFFMKLYWNLFYVISKLFLFLKTITLFELLVSSFNESDSLNKAILKIERIEQSCWSSIIITWILLYKKLQKLNICPYGIYQRYYKEIY